MTRILLTSFEPFGGLALNSSLEVGREVARGPHPDGAVVRWFVLQDGTYRDMEADAHGLCKSSVFPGLWLDAPALLQGDGRQVMATLRQGLETPEYATFVHQLQARRRAV